MITTTTLDDYNNNRAVSTRSPNLMLPLQVYFDGLTIAVEAKLRGVTTTNYHAHVLTLPNKLCSFVLV
ncbi:MAG TPA: hypothetical protein VJ729_07255 [Nitrososphaeraceae archaeon]|nr:hypothetical protein [Nitrososphaeraceae archaeon]